MNVFFDYNLKKDNSLRIEAIAPVYIEIESIDEVNESVNEFKNRKQKFCILGGGSNVLLDNISVLKLKQKEEINVKNSIEGTFIILPASINWDSALKYLLGIKIYGLENLSGIPGSCGGAIVQNIGAYGVSIDKFVHCVECVDLLTGQLIVLNNKELNYGYRDSVFKNSKKECLIIRITLFLPHKHNISTEYKSLSEHRLLKTKTPENIRDVILDIRKKKFYNTSGRSAGSFFKNLELSSSKLQKLKSIFPDLPVFKQGSKYRIPTGFLIEKLSEDCPRLNNVWFADNHKAILLARDASLEEIERVSKQTIFLVKSRFGVVIEPEVITPKTIDLIKKQR